MPNTMGAGAKPLPTVWEVSDELWQRMEPILQRRYPLARTGRPRADLRRVLERIIFRLRTGCQWNQLPERFGSDSTVHRWFQRWVADGVLEECGRCWPGSARPWAASTGAGRQPTGRWARHAWAAKKGSEPH